MVTTANINALIPQGKQEKIAQFLAFAGNVREVTVRADDEYQNASALLREIKTMLNGLEDDRKELVYPYKRDANAIDERYREVRRELDNGEAVLKRSMADWVTQKERERAEAQRKAEAEAAEQRRNAEEKAARERAKAEALIAQGKEAQAVKAEARAEAAQMQAEMIVAPVIESGTKAEGISYSTKYKVTVDDHGQAVKALAADPVLSRFLEIDIKGIERWVASLGGVGVPLPLGLRIEVEKVVSVRGKR